MGRPMDAKDGRNGAKGTRHTRDSKILGEFYHKKTINKREEERGHTKKLSTEKICLYKATTFPNERTATRTPCRHPKMTRIRQERADTRGRIRTHASILVYRPMYNEYFLKKACAKDSTYEYNCDCLLYTSDAADE